jgi:hypothetical protein
MIPSVHRSKTTVSELTDDDIDLVAKKVLGEEAKAQQELEAKKNDPRRQEAIASLFHVRDRDKVCGPEVTDQQELEHQRQE